MTAPRVIAISSRSFGSGTDDPTQTLRAAGYEPHRIGPAHDVDECGPVLAHTVGWIAGTGPIGPTQLDAAPNLRVISRYGIGVDSIDLVATSTRDVVVTNTPGANAAAVADHTIGLAIAALRDVVAGDAAVRRGDWSTRRGRELGACTFGIVGLGAVGREVAGRLAGFGAHVVAYDPYVNPRHAVVPLVDLERLLAVADIVSLHAPGQGRALIDAKAIASMRPGAVVVNVARASLVDERAVADALASGRLGAFASDVSSDEHGATSPLVTAPRTTLTPHVAGQTTEAIDRMSRAATEECLRVLRGDAPDHPVLPPASREEHP
jgi:D-3-phosphoglycerate dehydrogenase